MKDPLYRIGDQVIHHSLYGDWDDQTEAADVSTILSMQHYEGEWSYQIDEGGRMIDESEIIKTLMKLPSEKLSLDIN